MKVCHMSSAHYLDDIRIFHKECKSLAKAGFETFLVGAGDVNEVRDGVHIISATKKATSRKERMTVTAKAVFEKALSLDCDIYHFHDSELLPYGKKLRKLGKIVIYDSHEDLPRQIMAKDWIPLILRKPISFFIEKYENSAAKKMSFVITATQTIKNRFKKVNPNCEAINNFPSLSDIKLQNEGYLERENVLCYAGGISKVRGISAIFDAMENIDGKFNFAGIADQGYLNELSQHKNADKTKYLGVLDREGVNKLYKSATVGDCVLLTTPNHINSMPIKMFEYMGAGIPFVCSDFPLWKSIVKECDCGIAVSPENKEEIATAVNFLFENKERAFEMGKNGRDWAEKKYNWFSEEKKLVDIYNSLM